MHLRRRMHVAAGLANALQGTGPLKVLALMEATRVTGVARNVLEFATIARTGAGGLQIVFSFAIIRRGRPHSRPPDGLIAAVSAAGIPLDVIFERHRYDARLLLALRRLVDAHQPDIVETHHVKSHCLVALSGIARRYPWVAFHHGYTQTDPIVRAQNQMDRWSLRHAGHVVTTNHRFKRMLESRGVRRGAITVLHNAVRGTRASAEDAAALRARLGLAPGERVVLAVGRLSYEKGHEHLIRAAAAWRDRARVVIAGDGPDRPRIERLACEVGCRDTVILAGLTPHIAPFYAIADVFVLPSLTEGSPNALLEAMAAGLPIVATAVGGVPEIAADDVNALLVAPRDPEGLAQAVNSLLGNRERCERLGTMARLTVSSEYTPERRAAALANVYRTLLTYDRGSATTAAALAS
jgi:glycosyltransferase involved in cell wall biosynthesis